MPKLVVGNRSESRRRSERDATRGYDFFRKNTRAVRLSAGTALYRASDVDLSCESLVPHSVGVDSTEFFLSSSETAETYLAHLRSANGSREWFMHEFETTMDLSLLDIRPLSRIYHLPLPEDSDLVAVASATYDELDPKEPKDEEFDLELWLERLWDDLGERYRRHFALLPPQDLVLDPTTLGADDFGSAFVGFMCRHFETLRRTERLTVDGCLTTDRLGCDQVIFWNRHDAIELASVYSLNFGSKGVFRGPKRTQTTASSRSRRARNRRTRANETLSSSIEDWNAHCLTKPRDALDPVFVQLDEFRANTLEKVKKYLADNSR